MKSIKIDDLVIEYEVIIRNVKYWRLEIKDEKLALIIPHMHYDHEKIIVKHRKWIYRKFKEINRKKEEAKNLTIELRGEAEFKDLIREFVHKFSSELKVKVKKIYFRKMKSRWGSCSSRSNISINVHLNYLPMKLIEYVVFHEIAHLLELNHSKKFWSIVSSRFPDYKNLENELSIYWFAVKDRTYD